MSYESANVLAPSARVSDVLGFIKLLGYKRWNGHGSADKADGINTYEFYYFKAERYESYTPIELTVEATPGDPIVVYTRTTIGRSYYDLAHQNRTIRDLRRMFGGNFVTDYGRNRYGRDCDPPAKPDQAGCHLAFQNFGTAIIRASVYLDFREFTTTICTGSLRDRNWILDPKALSNHLLLPHLIATLEDYFKSSYIALLTYSERKAAILRNSRLTSDSLLRIASGERTVESAFAESLPFQRLSSVCQHFAALDPQLDLAGALKKPFNRRKASLIESIDQLVEMRHDFIHRNIMNMAIDNKSIAKALDDAEEVVVRSYRRLTSHYGWIYDQGWSRAKRPRKPRASRASLRKEADRNGDDTGRQTCDGVKIVLGVGSHQELSPASRHTSRQQ